MKNKGFHPRFILRCENPSPDFEDVFTFRIAIWYPNLKGKDAISRQAIREKVQKSFSFTHGLGNNQHWSKWICIWTGNSYKLTDIGDNDVEGLKTLLVKGIKGTLTDFKSGLERLAKMRL